MVVDAMNQLTEDEDINIELTETEYHNMINSIAFNVVYNIAAYNITEYLGSELQTEVNISLDIMSKLFNLPYEKLDEDFANAVVNVNREEAFELAHERNTNTLH